jgi:hypothetical protein
VSARQFERNGGEAMSQVPAGTYYGPDGRLVVPQASQAIPVDYNPFANQYPLPAQGYYPSSSGIAGRAPLLDAPGARAQITSTPISLNDAARAVATGVPIIGGLLNKMDAATNAALAPIFNPLFSYDDQLHGDTFADRYRNALAIQNGMDARFATEHPTANLGLNAGGAVLGTLPAAAAAPAAFGVGEFGIPSLLTGAATGGAIGGVDGAIRSEGDPDATLRAATLGAAFGLGAPLIGKAIQAGAGALANMTARLAPGFGARSGLGDLLRGGRDSSLSPEGQPPATYSPGATPRPPQRQAPMHHHQQTLP